MMGILNRFAGRAELPVDDDDDELDEDIALFQSGLRDVRYRPLEWSVAPPKKAGWYYVRRTGEPEYATYRVEVDFEYPAGFEWAGPLPEPTS